MRFLSLTPLFASLLVPFFAAQATAESADDTNPPVLIELFTSQSCSSCPRAEKLFAELSERDDLVVIEWHVDYWNTLMHGRDGRWSDPVSTRANTERQRDYNLALRNTGSVYTPQAVIAGYAETTGSRERAIERLINSAPKAYARVDVSAAGSGITVSVTPMPDTADMQAEVIFVEMISAINNEIRGGENKGLTASSRNVALSADTLGAWTGTTESYRASLDTAEANQCAVLVQEAGTGRILGASYCPPMDPALEGADALNEDFIGAHP
jgi:hypothetical protein